MYNFKQSERCSSIMAAVQSQISTSSLFFRKYKLGELPQTINILIGTMSFVDPIPDVISLYIEFFTAKAGITEDPDQLCDAIIKMSETSTTERALMGQRGYEYAVQNFDFQQITEKFSKQFLL